MHRLARKAAWLAAFGLVCLGVAIGATVGTKVDTAGAAKRHQPTTVWAVVDVDGDLVRGKGATTAFNQNTGTYFVLFARDVSTCAYTATTSGGFAGDTSVDTGLSPRDVIVSTANGATLQDLAFHLIVAC
jgi:hypothetical protein